jgi:hypothetical protein
VSPKANRFLEQLQRRQEAAQRGQTASEQKPIAELTDEELDAALAQAKRDLLDAQHAELRRRELERVSGATGERTASGARGQLADVLREKQRGKRSTRHW